MFPELAKLAYYMFSSCRDTLNLPQFNGHFKKYTDGYTMKKKGVSDEQAEAEV